jgi:hypothetical protein
MFKWLINRSLAKFERDFNYDMSYAREILDTDTRAFLKFSKVMGMARYRQGVPVDAWFAAGIVGTLAEDCGPCTQLGVTMAEREGVPASTIRAVLAGDPAAMPDDVALAYRFARESLAHSAEANELREQVVSKWGKKGLVSLAFALTTSRMFPTLKYALGHGQTCTRVTVGGTAMPVEQHQAV